MIIVLLVCHSNLSVSPGTRAAPFVNPEENRGGGSEGPAAIRFSLFVSGLGHLYLTENFPHKYQPYPAQEDKRCMVNTPECLTAEELLAASVLLFGSYSRSLSYSWRGGGRSQRSWRGDSLNKQSSHSRRCSGGDAQDGLRPRKNTHSLS